ncbi:hypothetical protein DRE_01126 [Drechslerella stenobrocha 248]|uniref:FAD-binding PCMH-type domain-containing protein n=1 Tax=Drechslerella stenobrocha 248 TaxID=1043628 RepID=W7I6A5_9PEZI|nr:hypothetical protein DRE_01126 [Drechslerella stenobrocha 248]
MKLGELSASATHLLTSLAYLTSTRVFVEATGGAACKCRPSESCWPDSRAWSRLNITTNGALLKTVPPGIVCYPGPAYDKGACEELFKISKYHSWIAQSPFNVMQPGWNGDPCPPTNGTANGTCNSLLGDPVYVVNATDPSQVEAGVKFARKYNIRLIVKNTGHEFLGRSSGAHSLSIFTHNLQTVEFAERFRPQGCRRAQPHSAVTVGAGVQWKDLVPKADEQGKLVVSGGNPTVGCVGGFLQGGGHSPISNKYGLAVDQVLEFKLVTPSGKYITANECENSDYYWALRGGGGSTFGVVTSATLKTYPTQHITTAAQSFNLTSDDTDVFWDWMAYVHSEIPRLSEAGVMGYSYIFNDTSTQKLSWMALLTTVGGSTDEITQLLDPLYANATSEKYKDHIASGQSNVTFPSFATYFSAVFREDTTRGPTLLPSRLLDGRALTEDPVLLAATLKKMWGPFVGAYLGHLVGGPGVSQYKNVDMALNPAWRRTYNHLIVGSGFDTDATKDVALDYAKNVFEYNLRKLAPDSGQYLNEAAYNSEGWQQANWGENYPRLFTFKNKVDPDGVLYCWNCVGSEKWVVGENGSLCRASWA